MTATSPDNMPRDHDQYINDRQAAEYLGISLASLRRWRGKCAGPRYYRIGHSIRYRYADLDDYVQIIAPIAH